MSGSDTIETTVGKLNGTMNATTNSSMREGCVIEVVEGPAAGKRLQLEAKALVGRKETCDLVIEDKTVSREHLRLTRKGNKVTVLSLVDQNPVLVNGKAVKEGQLADGDSLTLGDSVLRVHLPGLRGKGKKSKKQTNKVRLALYVLLLVCGIGVLAVALSPKDKEERPAELSVLEQEQLKQQQIKKADLQRNISVHLANGIKLFEQKDIIGAKSRFARVVELDASNTQALAYLDKIAAMEKERTLQEEAQRKKEMEQREKLSPLLSKANVFMGTKNFKEAREILLQAKEVAPENEEIASLLAAADKALAEQEREMQKQAQLHERREQRSARSFEKAKKYQSDKQYYRALKEYQYLLTLEDGGAYADAAKKAVPMLEKALYEQTKKEYERGLKLLEDEKTAEALAVWEEVLLVFPEHRDARAQIDRLLPMIAEKGKQLYRDGLVLEDLGQIERAMEKWNEAMTLLSILNNNEYLDKSRAKIEQYRSLMQQ